jgi:hypothetical protein
MIDNFSLLVSHSLILLAAWRLVFRPDLDVEAPPSKAKAPVTLFSRPSVQKDGDDA